MQIQARASRAILRATMAAIVAAAGGVALLPAAHAAAPQVKTSAPGYYRVMLGDFEVTALSDGTVNLPVDKLLHEPAPKTTKALARSFQQAPVETSINAYLINTGSKLVLVDTGAAGLFGPTTGKLLANLKAAGYSPEQVDDVFITHMHPDHIGGLGGNGERTFPNATVHADQRDADFWLSQANLDKATAENKGSFQGPINAIGPYQKAGKFAPFSGDTTFMPGISGHAAYGHTPGHTTYKIESNGQTLVLWGDLMHVAAVQFDDPSVTIEFDSDSKAAAVQRKAAYAEAVKTGELVGAAHLSFPGLGHLRAEGKGYRFIPLSYGLIR
ncbi:MAG TPA: MBL fold metallo-hydrolase [Ideonella sp.]|uniref:MBL fold metallo-hydrolase n=1 Tax=Ideonella sp. TaxID=1929293 RepID=UPI002CF04275|nr:MBL fold metallo-hydrolase [Ideonella sp.]HSI48813.1 MBL fold metallo-hydrolase [Ideonella sp.]